MHAKAAVRHPVEFQLETEPQTEPAVILFDQIENGAEDRAAAGSAGPLVVAAALRSDPLGAAAWTFQEPTRQVLENVGKAIGVT